MAKSFSSLKKAVGSAGYTSANKSNEKKKEFKDIKVSDYDFSPLKSDLEDKIRFDTFTSDIKSLNEMISNAQNGWLSPETMKGTRLSIENMNNRVNSLNEYQKLFGDRSELPNNYKDILGEWDNLSNYYGQFDSADAYNKAKKQAEADAKLKQEMLSADLDVRNAEVYALEYKLGEAGKLKKKYDNLESQRSTAQYSSNLGNDTSDWEFRTFNAKNEYEKYLKEIGYSSYEELEKDIGEKKKYINRAEWLQEGETLSSVSDVNSTNYDKGYEAYATKGMRIAYDEVGEKKRYYGKAKPGVSVIDSVRAAAMAMYERNGHKGEFEDSGYTNLDTYRQMNDEEFKNFAYWLAKDAENGGNQAERYLHTIEETLEGRVASTEFNEYKDKTFKELLYGIEAGLDQFATGLENLVNFEDDYVPVNHTQQLSGMIRNDLSDDGFEILGTSLGQGAYDLITTTTNMLPSVLTSMAVGTVSKTAGAWVGTTLMGASAAGNAYQEMLNLGYDKSQARVYSTLVGASEALLERALGGISAFGGISGKVAKAVSGIDNALARFAIRYGTSMASEGFEEAVQEVLNPLFKSIATGEAPEDIDWSEVAYSGLLGALSGGLMEGPSLAIGTAREQSARNNLGQNIRANENIGDVLDLASVQLSPEESSAYEAYAKYANKKVNADNIKNSQVGNLAIKLRADAEAVLNSESATPEERAKAEKIIADLEAYGQNSTSSIYKKMAKDLKNDKEGIGSLIDEALELEKNTEAYKLASEYSERYKKGEKITETEVAKLIETMASEDTDDVSVDVEKRLTELGEKGDVSKISDIVMKKSAGQLLSSTETEILENSEYGNRVLAEMEQDFNSELIEATEGMDKADAELFIQNYDGEADIEEYSADFNLALTYSKNNFNPDTILANRGVLSPRAVGNIYNRAVVAPRIARQRAIDDIIVKHSGKISYEPTIDDSVIDYDNKGTKGKVNWNSLTQRQREAITFIKGFAKVAGVNVKFVNDGEYNGKYKRSENTIYIDIRAGMDSARGAFKDSLIPTFSHELVHWAKAKSPILYAELSKKVFDALKKSTGLTEAELVANEQTRLKNKNGKDYSYDYAKDEIIARSCEDMLSMSEEGRNLFNSLSEKEQKTLVEKLKEFIQNIIDMVNELLGQYESKSEEATKLRDFKEELQDISKTYDKMLMSAIEANKALETEGIRAEEIANEATQKVGIGVDMETKSAYPSEQFSEKTWTHSEYVENREVAVNALVKAIGVTKSEAERYIDNINSIARLIADDRVRLDYDSNIDNSATVLKSNQEYKWTLDMSTLCAKRLLTTGTFDAIQKALPNTVFDSEDIVSLREMMLKRGYEVACGICYVESTRRELGPITAEFIERYKESQRTGKPITRINSEGKEKLLQEKGTKNVFYADKNYTPTLAELNTTDIDLVKRDHPEVYSAYLTFMNARGQAKPKLLETRAEYNGDILKHFNKSAVESRNKAGGLRVQSFSDFEVAHLIDMMQAVLDMSRVGLKSQAYTKVPAFADVFGGTGMKINLSLIAKDSGLDENGNLIFDDVEGINHKEAFRLREKYSKNVGTILVGKNDAHIISAMADPRIDFIIPFRKSSWKESLYDALGLTGYDDYTDYQNEKPIDKDRKIKNFQPSEYWDYSKSGDENAQIYLEKCKEDGRIPKFPQFQIYPGYWKLLIDFKMYDNDGVGSPQNVVKPEFDMESANTILNNYEGGHRSFPVAKDVVRDFVKEYKEKHQQANEDEQFSEKITELTSEDDNKLKKFFGTTGNYNVAGYMLKNGTMLDFSGKHWGDTSSTFRQVDHRDIWEVWENPDRDGTDEMVNMIANGNIRLIPETGGINLAVAPSKNQRVVLRRYIEYMSRKEGIVVDIDKVGGDTIKSFTYDKGVSADRVMRDIDNYFKGRATSELMQFHTMADEDVQFCERSNDPNEFNPDGLTLRGQLEEAFDTSQSKERRYVYVGRFTQSFVDKLKQHIEIKNFPIVMNYRDAYLSMESKENGKYQGKGINYHNLGVPGLEAALKSFDRPEYVLMSTNEGKIELILEGRDYKNRQLFSIVEVNTKAQNVEGYLDAHVVNSVYGNRSLNKRITLAEQQGRLIYDKNKDEEISQGTPQVQYERGINDKASSKDSIDDSPSKSNEQFVNFEDEQMSEKTTAPSAYDLVGEHKTLEKRYKKLEADFENYKERVKLDRTLTKGKVLKKSDIEAVARFLIKQGDSNYKTSELAKLINDLYVDLREGAMDGTMTWDEMYAKAYEVAEIIRSEAKVKIERPAYYDKILKDIRSARIAPNEEQKGDAKHRFGDHYVGKFRGRVTIANDGMPLDEKWSYWAREYPKVFDKGISPAQQLVELYDIYDELRNAGDVVQEYEESEMLHSLATEIINKAWLVTNYESTADKYDKRIKELNYEHTKAMEELKNEFGKKVADARLLEQMYYGRKMLEKNKEVAKQRLADDMHYGKILNKLHTKRIVEVNEAKRLGRERLAQYKENAERKSVIQSIANNSLKLNKMLLDNSRDSHVPEIMKDTVIELLQVIDFSSKRLLNGGEPTQRDIALSKALHSLQTEMLIGNKDENNLGSIFEEMYGSGIDETLAELIKSVDKIMATIDDKVFVLNAMSVEDLKRLNTIVKIIKRTVNRVNQYHVARAGLSARLHGFDTISDLEKRTKLYDDDKHHFDKLKTKVYWNNLNPYYAFRNLGESAQEIFTAFQDGQDKLAFLAKEIIDFTEGLYTAKEYKKWSETYFEFNIPQPSGKTAKFSMNVPQIMSLYCVIKQEDARKHILHGDENGEGGGITIAETKDKRAVRKNIRITEADLENIISKLDSKMLIKAKGGTAKEVADKLQEYMGTRGAELGNEITMARWGIKSFGIENYFPIKVSEGAVPAKGDTPGDVVMSMLQLLNASFTHSRNHMSKKSVEIGDIFDVFSSHMSNMARYNALALPILDMYKWLNFKDVTEAGEEISVQESVKEAFGDYAWGYLQTFLKDVSGSSKSDTRDNLAVRFFKNSKIAKVAGNIRVALLQFTSFIRAGAVMDNKYLLHALHYKPKIQQSEEKCGIVLWKSLGYYDTDITRGLTSKIKHDENLKDKVVDWSLKGAEWADKVTMGVLWNACELEIRDTRKDLAVGSKEFYEAIALRLREVIYRTQVVDSMLTRSQMMRSPGGWDKMLTTFASESTLSLNLMTDIFVSTSLEARETNLKTAMQKNGKYIRKAITAYVVTNIVTTILQSVFDAFRDYDEDEKDEGYWTRLMLENFAVNSSMFAKIPYINLAVSAIQGFSASRADADWMNNTVKAGKEIVKLMSGDGDPIKLLNYVLKSGSDVTGIAAYNIYRDILALYMNLFGED